MQQVIDALKAAREKISKPEHWTQNAFARDAKGQAVGELSGEACSYCAIGACYALRVHTIARSAVGALEQTLRESGQESAFVAMFNDAEDTTHDDVLDLFDGTIQRLENQEDAHTG